MDNDGNKNAFALDIAPGQPQTGRNILDDGDKQLFGRILTDIS